METNTRTADLSARLSEWNARHPVLAIVVVSLIAVVINCHPVLFCGRSYVSPASMGMMVYSWAPVVPGLEPGIPETSAHGSDASATMIQGIPASYHEYRSLLQGELPLWNRYGHAGQPFLGQAITMLGDPLHLIVLLGRNSPLAWDLKFVTAKFLFCVGFGLLVRRIVGSQPLALLYAALAAYCGAYFYINNHPVFFVFAYAPWIFFLALKFPDPRERQPLRWQLAWLLANFACFNAGHVEVAVILIGALNLAALTQLLVVSYPEAKSQYGVIIGRMALGTLLFLGLTAPVWVSFLAALPGAFSGHTNIQVFQVPWKYMAGVFDDLLYQLCLPNDTGQAIAPGTSLLVLVGCLWSVFRWRQLRREPFFWINGAAIAFWGGCVFGWVPAFLLAQVPLLNRDGHTHIDFSYLLVIHLTLQSAYGFRALARENNLRRAAVEFLCIAALMAGLMTAYVLGLWHRSIPWAYFAGAAGGALGAPLLYAYWSRRGTRISPAAWAAIILLGFGAQHRFGIYGSGDHMLQLVGPRSELAGRSPALEHLARDPSGPFRVVGLQYNLFGDYAMAYHLEDIRSCQPLASGEFMDLVMNFPGIKFGYEWIIEVKKPLLAQPLLNLLNVKYLLTMPGFDLPSGVAYRMVDQEDFGVVENLAVWPRAFFTDRVMPAATTAEFIKELEEQGAHPFAALSPQDIQTHPELSSLTATSAAVVVPATNYWLGVNSTAFEIHAPSAGVVCLTETQARDFVATANGEVKPVLTVNRAFKGVFLDRAGDYHIQFTYRPRYWHQACLLFWLALAGTAGWSIACARQTFRWQRDFDTKAIDP